MSYYVVFGMGIVLLLVVMLFPLLDFGVSNGLLWIVLYLQIYLWSKKDVETLFEDRRLRFSTILLTPHAVQLARPL